MRTRKDKRLKESRKNRQVHRRRLTLMAVQEKLGLFSRKTAGDKEEQDHEYLKNKPLGLI